MQRRCLYSIGFEGVYPGSQPGVTSVWWPAQVLRDMDVQVYHLIYHLLTHAQKPKALAASAEKVGAEEPSINSGYLFYFEHRVGHWSQTACSLIFSYPVLMEWPWPGNLASPGLSFFICKVGQ